MRPVQDDPLGQIPPEHPWFKAVVDLVVGLQKETFPSLLAPPSAGTSNDARNYDAGRMAMGEDILARLRARQRVAEAADASD